LQDDEARACIVAKFKQLEFPPPQPSGRVPITYPLLLDPSLIANQTTSAPQDEELNEYNRARPPFNPAHAAKAFASVDLSPCASAGFHGQGHVTITFDPSGVVTKAEIDSPSQMAPAAKSCVSKAFATARVAVFSGDAVTVGKTFRVP